MISRRIELQLELRRMQRSNDVAHEARYAQSNCDLQQPNCPSRVALPLSTEGAKEKFALCTKVFCSRVSDAQAAHLSRHADGANGEVTVAAVRRERMASASFEELAQGKEWATASYTTSTSAREAPEGCAIGSRRGLRSFG